MKDKAFTIWAREAMNGIQLAKSTEFNLIFGVAYFGEIWFRFASNYLYCHQANKAATLAIMERRDK